MAQSEGWLQVLRPHLETQLREAFPDPTAFENDEKYLYAAKTTSIYKKIIAELLQWVESHEQRLLALQKKLDGQVEVDNFEIGKDDNGI